MLASKARTSSAICARAPRAARGPLNLRLNAVTARAHVTRPALAPAAPRTARSRRCVAAARAEGTADAVSKLTDELRVLETERDEAVKTAESCARTSVRLEEMVQLLDRLALEKIRDGDEEGARQVVTEKASTKDVLERTNARAQVNYQLASKLADKIGRVQLQLVQMLAPGDAPRPSAAPAAAPPPAAAAPGPSAPQQPAGTEPQYAPRKPDWEASLEAARARLAAAEAAAPAASSAAAPAPSAPRQPAAPASGGYGGGAAAPQYAARKPDWEASLEAARARLAAAEAAAASEGRRPAWQPRESLEEARERLRAQAVSGVVEAQQRMRSRASESISEARARIAAEDEAVLAKVQALMARYRRGEYVSEDELEWAFRQLEKRFVV